MKYSSLLIYLLIAFLVRVSNAQEAAPKEPEVAPQPTRNATGLQIGVADTKDLQFPDGTEDLAEKGALAAADREWAKSREIYLEILEKDPDNALTLSNLGAIEFRTGNLEKAVEYLEFSLREAPTIAQNWLTLGLIHYRQGHSNLAISSLTRSLHEDPGDPRAHNYLAIVIRERGWNLAAETELQRAIVLDPGYADAHFNLAVMYLDKTPPALELARRHYHAARDYGAEPDESIVAKLKPPAPKKEGATDSDSDSEPEAEKETKEP
ncbi:MAG: tetratricopeptide (TPR) repeat protein [Verrucomicrobiales bacterium]|jgi:tetratricopeptide (TPR) repeat protein